MWVDEITKIGAIKLDNNSVIFPLSKFSSVIRKDYIKIMSNDGCTIIIITDGEIEMGLTEKGIVMVKNS